MLGSGTVQMEKLELWLFMQKSDRSSDFGMVLEILFFILKIEYNFIHVNMWEPWRLRLENII